MSRSPSLFLAGEASAVIAALRSNAKFNRYADDEVEDPLLEDFKALRRKLFSWRSWDEVDPLEYLTPFLETIKSPETSGPITLVALAALDRIIRRGILSASGGGIPAESMQVVADGVTQCKFEATYPASDECVLHKILDVLVACVGCPGGSLLTHDNLINIFQACYHIGHFQTEKGRDASEVLTQASRQAMAEMVHHIFARLESIAEPLDSPFASTTAAHTTSRLHVSPVPSRAALLAEAGEGEAGTEAGATTIGAAAEAAGGEAAASSAAALPPAADSDAPPATPDGATGTADAAEEESAALLGEQLETPAPPSPHAHSPMTGEIVTLLPVLQTSITELEGYGLEAVREVLRFIISIINMAPVGPHQDLPAHGLDLMSTALQAAGPSLATHESLMVLLQQDLVRAMFAAAKQPSLACLAGICQVALGMYVNLGSQMLLQVEALLGLLLLPLAEGKGSHHGAPLELQQAALEGVLDFCSQPGFARDVYLNLDCRIERSNLFEQLCGLLSKTAFPVSGPLAAVHLQSLDGILAILAALADSCNGVSDLDAGSTVPLSGPESYVDIWSSLCAGDYPPLEAMLGDRAASPAERARVEKFLKGRLAAAADHFNRDSKKGFQFLQSLKLLPPQLDPPTVARFLRCCPGLAKPSIGEILGERDAFYEDVRTAFMETFDFRGMDFDLALRMFMDSFRPPGEGQKIDRIMQVFGKRYHDQMPSMGLRSSDAAYVLAFSVIMLNTDLHNTQNKKKMTLDDFARINRSTNDGDPMPRPLLEGIYASIAGDELKISSESTANELPSVFWYQLTAEARRPRGRMQPGATTDEALERDMFGLIWGPTLAAVSVVLDNASDPAVVARALECLQLAARMAAYHQVDEVVDSIAASLARFTAVLAPPNGAAAFGGSSKARGALQALFAVANRHGDLLRSGWRNVIDAVLRLHRLDLLPAAVIATDGEEPEDARLRLPRPASINKTRGSSGSLFSRAITSLISIDGSDAVSAEQAAAREAELAARAVATVEACHIDEVFADSKFLTGESLVELVKAVMWSAGNVAGAARSGENTSTSELCLELLITLALRNRDRVALIWPLLHEFLSAVTAADNAKSVNPLVERAVTGLLRICQRLLPYKEDTAETLLRSLKLVIGLSPNVVWELAETIAIEMLALLKSSAPYVRSESDWRTVCAILKLVSVRPEAAPLAYDCLSVACNNSQALSADSYMPLLEACLQFLERYKQQNIEAAVHYLDLVEVLFTWLVAQSVAAATARSNGALSDEGTLTDEQLVDLWLTTVGVLAKNLCKDECQPLRDNSIMVLSRALVASERLHLPPELWVQTLQELLVPVATDLARLAVKKSKSHPGAEKSVRLAVSMLAKTVLQYIEVVQGDKDFYALWQAVLQALQDCMAVRHEAVQESVPENAKNMLLVLASSGILTPTWQDSSGRSLWDLTFSKVHFISSGLNPSMLQATLSPQSREVSPRPLTDGVTSPGAASASPAVLAAPDGAAPAAAEDGSGSGLPPVDASAAHTNGLLVDAAVPEAMAAAGAVEPSRDEVAAAVGGAEETPKPASRSSDGGSGTLEGVRSHPISPEHLEETPGQSQGAAAPAAVSTAGPGDSAAANTTGVAVAPEAAAAVGTAAAAAVQRVQVAAVAKQEEEAEEEEYGAEAQAEQSSSTCKQS
ncbi:hypothetical protein D9Q98_007841 [Chlorella vulgaris]|uniref:SEC7 domain-containing protein n=1 Tax=Chlorella vulgaris TaxID=3077 RepID=A0A9D4THJ9_CHLVU|nr:hypothetical protein D9Q98_007841 [Chlorella vulgaris]